VGAPTGLCSVRGSPTITSVYINIYIWGILYPNHWVLLEYDDYIMGISLGTLYGDIPIIFPYDIPR
jgi:hypothetical protein